MANIHARNYTKSWLRIFKSPFIFTFNIYISIQKNHAQRPSCSWDIIDLRIPKSDCQKYFWPHPTKNLLIIFYVPCICNYMPQIKLIHQRYWFMNAEIWQAETIFNSIKPSVTIGKRANLKTGVSRKQSTPGVRIRR